MQTNRYIHLWLPIMGLHALHQVEESISFWQWYIDFVDKIPQWLQLPRIAENAQLANEHPEYFIGASIGQLTLVAVIAFLCRKGAKSYKNCSWDIPRRIDFLLGMAYLNKLFHPFLFTRNGNLSHRRFISSRNGGISCFKKIETNDYFRNQTNLQST